MDELLKILAKNALESPENIGKMMGVGAADVRKRIAAYEKSGVIRGYQAVLDEDKLDLDAVTAVIEVKVLPEREGGFDRIAKRLSKFDEVRSLYLMSGSFDLLLFVAGPTLKHVAQFVSEKLATVQGVTATATHFMMKTYKSRGVLMETPHEQERLQVSP